MIPCGDRWLLCRPPLYRLLTLWDFMKKLEPQVVNFILAIYALGKSAETFPDMVEQISTKMRIPLPKPIVVANDLFPPDELKSWAAKFRQIGLNVSANLLDEMVEDAGSAYGRKQNDTVPELARQIRRELDAIHLMVVPNDKIDLIKENRDAFNPAVAAKFEHEIVDELQQAGPCLAFGRNTACVFHLVRVVEAGLREAARKMGVPKSKHMPTWDAVFREIDVRLEKLRATKKKSRAINRRIAFLSETRLHIHAIKDAWRNPTVHEVAKTYDEQQATRVYRAVWALMGHLAAAP